MNIKPLANLTRLLVVLLKVNVGLLIIAVFAGIYGWIEYLKLPSSINANDTLLSSDILNAIVGVIQFFFWIFLAVTFLRWIYRTNKNLHILSSQPMTFTPGWSVGWYFIPIANLFKPYQAMKEIWSVAHRGNLNTSALLAWWWCLWVISIFLGRWLLRLSLQAHDNRTLADSAAAYAISDALDIMLNVLALRVVRTIAKAYSVNYSEHPPATSGATDVPMVIP